MLCLREDIFSLVQIDIHMHLKAIKLSQKQHNHRSLECSLFSSILELHFRRSEACGANSM